MSANTDGLEELDVVRLLCHLPEHGLEIHDLGTVVLVFDQPSEAYEVEFGVERNDSVLVTLQRDQLEPVKSRFHEKT